LSRRLEQSAVLRGHRECVNRISWSENGDHLLSGSDDATICVWNAANAKLESQLTTEHKANIFGVRFIPGTCCKQVVSGGLDGLVQVSYVERTDDASVSCFDVHRDAVKTVDVEPLNPFLIFSSSEDGTVRQFDLRVPHDPSSHYILIGLNPSNSSFHVSFKSAAINPVKSHQILVAADDGRIRLYDRRMLQVSNGARTSTTPDIACVLSMVPRFDSQRRFLYQGLILGYPFPTHVAFSNDGERCVAPYSGEGVYVFDLRSNGQLETKCEADDRPQNGSRRPFLACIQRLQNGIRFLTQHGNTSAAIESFDLALFKCRASQVETSIKFWRSAALLERLFQGDSRAALSDASKVHHRIRHAETNSFITLDLCSSNNAWCICSDVRVCEYLIQWQRIRALMNMLYLMFNLIRNIEVCSSVKQFVQMNRAVRTILHEHRSHSTEIQNATTSQPEFLIHPYWASILRSIPEVQTRFDREIEYTLSEMQHGTIRLRVGFSNILSTDSGESRNMPTDLKSAEETLVDLLGSVHDLNYGQRFVGSCNQETDIKEATFGMAGRDDFIFSGSDDGRLYVWSSVSGELLNAVTADQEIVNGCQPHPTLPLIGVCGIDESIKLLSPGSQISCTSREVVRGILRKRRASNLHDMQFSSD